MKKSFINFLVKWDLENFKKEYLYQCEMTWKNIISYLEKALVPELNEFGNRIINERRKTEEELSKICSKAILTSTWQILCKINNEQCPYTITSDKYIDTTNLEGLCELQNMYNCSNGKNYFHLSFKII